MNTVAKLYKQSLSIFNIAPASHQAETSLIDLVSSFVASSQAMATVDIIPTDKDKVKESTKALWQSLEEYDLCIRFIPRKDKHALVVLQHLEPKPCPFIGTKVIAYSIKQSLAA